MPELMIIVLDDEGAAFAAGEALVLMQQGGPALMEDVVVVTRGPDGTVRLNHSVDLATGRAIGGGSWGTLIGLIFVPDADEVKGGGEVKRGGEAKPGDEAKPGMAAKLAGLGLDADFLRAARHSLDHGGAAVGLVLRNLSAEVVLERLARFSPRPLRATLDPQTEAALGDFLATFPALPANPAGVARVRT